jgi:hypothetical protein
MTHIKNKILKIVQDNNLTMIPKWKFMLYSSFALAVLGFFFLLLIFSMSLILFVLFRYGFMYLPFFGFKATLHAITAIPLLLFGITMVLLGVVEVLTRKYSFSFKRPLSITVLSITLLASLCSFFVSQTSLHDSVYDYARGHHIDFVSRAYDRPFPFNGGEGVSVLRGIVMATSSSSFVLEMFGGETKTVHATTTYALPPLPEVGTDVVVVGSIVNDVFELHSFREAPRMPFEQKHKRWQRHDFRNEIENGEIKNNVGR